MALVLSLLMKLWQNVLHKLLEVDLAFLKQPAIQQEIHRCLLAADCAVYHFTCRSM